MSSTASIKVQKFGRFLSSMIMPIIGAFIAWGLITALFIPTGWFPNETLAKLVDPMVKYMLPLLIGYTGGKLIANERGGVIGAIATFGVVVGTDIPMFIGAMVMGPLGAYVIKKSDEFLVPRTPSGFEMLVQNFSIGILACGLAVSGFLFIGPVVVGVTSALTLAVKKIVDLGLLPLISIVIEPAKIFFLNNAVNHAIFTPLGAEQVSNVGKSIFYLIETNPGPGLGILLAYMFFGKNMAKQSASGASIIHLFGGIHEIYFPYVLMKPTLILAVVAGGFTGVSINLFFNAGLSSVASPGSIIAIMLVASKGSHLAILASIFAAAGVSFFIASTILKMSKDDTKEDEFAKAKQQSSSMKLKKENTTTNAPATSQTQASVGFNLQSVTKIIVACDAGMGSSAMGASILRKKIKEAELDIEVTNLAINNLPNEEIIVITHKDLTPRAQQIATKSKHYSLTNFLDLNFYQQIVKELKQQN